MVENFDKTAKRRFENPDDDYLVRFGNIRDDDLQYGIEAGALRIPGWVASLGVLECLYLMTTPQPRVGSPL
jgi:hypothetical protein